MPVEFKNSTSKEFETDIFPSPSVTRGLPINPSSVG
jgi:hypothetical protein